MSRKQLKTRLLTGAALLALTGAAISGDSASRAPADSTSGPSAGKPAQATAMLLPARMKLMVRFRPCNEA